MPRGPVTGPQAHLQKPHAVVLEQHAKPLVRSRWPAAPWTLLGARELRRALVDVLSECEAVLIREALGRMRVAATAWASAQREPA